MSTEVYKEGSRIGKDTVRVHRGGNRIDGVSHDNELFFTDLPKPNRSKIDLSFDRKLSFDPGMLVPILAQECVPGDTFHIAQAHNLMLAPLIAPLFHRLDYKTWYFFVPTRLVDDTWKDFITYKNSSYILPYFTGKDMDTYAGSLNLPGNLLDYLDLPVQETNWASSQRHCLAHIPRCYNLIWNEFYRDEFKQTEVPIYKTGGAVTSSEMLTYYLKKIGWEKDYFTTCQIAPQVGADVDIPISIAPQQPLSTFALEFQDKNGNVPTSGAASFNGAYIEDSAGSKLRYKSGLTTVGTINDLRMANHLQRYRDRLQIAGQRYNEQILAEFGVVVPDYRIQRPEYIGGYSQPVEIGKVMQTTPTSSSPLAAYAGSGVGSGRMDYIHYDCMEHGYIIGLCSVVPRSGYDQGIPRQYIKRDIFDYYHPEFSTLGDQEVLNDEIFVRSGTDNSRFGYNQRYSEYKYANDKTNSEFRTSLNFWHMNREFLAAPSLGGAFVQCDPTTRVFAQQNLANYLYAEIYQRIDSVRPMPISVVPNLENDN